MLQQIFRLNNKIRSERYRGRLVRASGLVLQLASKGKLRVFRTQKSQHSGEAYESASLAQRAMPPDGSILHVCGRDASATPGGMCA